MQWCDSISKIKQTQVTINETKLGELKERNGKKRKKKEMNVESNKEQKDEIRQSVSWCQHWLLPLNILLFLDYSYTCTRKFGYILLKYVTVDNFLSVLSYSINSIKIRFLLFTAVLFIRLKFDPVVIEEPIVMINMIIVLWSPGSCKFW